MRTFTFLLAVTTLGLLASMARAQLFIGVTINDTATATHTPAVGQPTVLTGVLNQFYAQLTVPPFPPPPPGSFFSLQQTAPDGTVMSFSGNANLFKESDALSAGIEYKFNFQGTASGTNLIALTGQIGYIFSSSRAITALVSEGWFLNGVLVSSNDQQFQVPAGGTLSGFVPEAFPAAASGLNQGTLDESVFLQALPPTVVPEPPTTLSFLIGGALLTGWFWRKWF
jgi:hypothetical protein